MNHNALALALLSATTALPTSVQAADDFCSRLVIYAINQFCQLLPNGQSLCQPIGLAGPAPGFEQAGEPPLYQVPMGPASIQIPTFPYFAFGTNPYPSIPFAPHPYTPYSFPQLPSVQLSPYAPWPTMPYPSAAFAVPQPLLPHPSLPPLSLPDPAAPRLSESAYPRPAFPAAQLPPTASLIQPAAPIQSSAADPAKSDDIVLPALSAVPSPEALQPTAASLPATATPSADADAQEPISPSQPALAAHRPEPQLIPSSPLPDSAAAWPGTSNIGSESPLATGSTNAADAPGALSATAEPGLQTDAPVQLKATAQDTIPAIETQTGNASDAPVPASASADPTPAVIAAAAKTPEAMSDILPEPAAKPDNADAAHSSMLPPATETAQPDTAIHPTPLPAPALTRTQPGMAAEQPPRTPATVEPTLLPADALAHFDFDSAELTEAGRSMLDAWLESSGLITTRSSPILVTGHADRLGSAPYNQELSLLRAHAVKKYLTDKGIASSRIRLLAQGESMPLIDCSGGATPQTIACLAPNRRAEVESLPAPQTVKIPPLGTANYPALKASQKRVVKIAQPKTKR